jgi:hypothetical protein
VDSKERIYRNRLHVSENYFGFENIFATLGLKTEGKILQIKRLLICSIDDNNNYNDRAIDAGKIIAVVVPMIKWQMIRQIAVSDHVVLTNNDVKTDCATGRE